MTKKNFKPQFLIVFIIFAICNLTPGFVLPAEKNNENVETTPFVVLVFSSENAIGLKDDITVKVTNIEKLQDEAREKDKKIILYIDGLPLNGIYPIFDRENNVLRFFIDHSDNAIELWNRLTLSRESKEIFTRQVSISVGLEDQEPILTKVNKFTLIIVRKRWFTISVVILLILLGSFIFLAIKTNILRDAGPNPTGGRKKPYSLALTQMATWFFVIISSWLLLYAVKHTFSTITESLVILMGISAGTGIGGVAIDNSKDKVIKSRHSKGFFKDILSDANGISFHRFQVFAWTIVMVAVFIRQVTSYMLMPEFSPALLTLMGISSGTYLGFKVSERPDTVDTPPAKENNETSQPTNG